MAKSKRLKPSIATYGDYELITPPDGLRMTVSEVPDSDAEDPVARAEQALAQLSGNFSTWMNAECDRLDAVRQEIKANGFSEATCAALFSAAHDIRGEAATFGYPLVGFPADSLCRLIEHTPDMNRIPMTLVDQHVDTVRAIVREAARADIQEVADALTKRLREVTDDFLQRENKDRPEALAYILSPSIDPSDQPL
jgi:HPt (histidine-containing phosphotransfer) domain-containing protein